MIRAATLMLAMLATAANAAATETAKAPPTPALFRVSDADSAIFLFAAAPILPKDESWRSRAVAAAIDSSETIVFEAPSADRRSQAEANAIFTAEGRFVDGSTLSSALGDDGASLLAAATADLGAEPAAFDPLKPWAAFVVLSAELDRIRGGDPASGVEAAVLKEAVGRQRNVQFLDSVQGALRVLTDMREQDQKAMLSYFLADWPRRKEAALAEYANWRKGDAEAVAAALSPLKEAAPQAYDRLIVDRARFLAERVANLLASPDEAFVCLPATLVFGEDGVAAELASKGLTVERIDGAAERR